MRKALIAIRSFEDNMGGPNLPMKKLNEYKTILNFLREHNFRTPDSPFEFPLLRLNELINAPEYRTFRIPKKQGGFRIINSPDFDLKQIQLLLNDIFQFEYSTALRPSCVHGFVSAKGEQSRKLGIYSNALPHVNKNFVMNIDIKDFFPSTIARSVKSILLKKLALNDNMASVITQLCTFNKQLPAGAPTSPVLSNICCIDMDHELMACAKENNVTYTRYADDLTFSSDTEIPSNFIENIKKILKHNGFAFNKRKFRVKTKHQRQTVTGLVVNKKVSVNRKYKRKLRAIIHDIDKNGIRAAALKHYKIPSAFSEVDHIKFGQKVRGMKAFVAGIKKENEIIINK